MNSNQEVMNNKQEVTRQAIKEGMEVKNSRTLLHQEDMEEKNNHTLLLNLMDNPWVNLMEDPKEHPMVDLLPVMMKDRPMVVLQAENIMLNQPWLML